MPEATFQVTVDHPFVIRDPSISFVNVNASPAANVWMQNDANDLRPVFGRRVGVENGRIPFCDVLFAYCELGPATEIVGSKGTLRDLMIAARARIVVIASATPASTLKAPEFVSTLTARTKEWPTNLVLIADRNDPHFGPFFRSLFERMWSGVSMVVAWNQLAPQIPNLVHQTAPGALFLAELDPHRLCERRRQASRGRQASKKPLLRLRRVDF